MFNITHKFPGNFIGYRNLSNGNSIRLEIAWPPRMFFVRLELWGTIVNKGFWCLHFGHDFGFMPSKFQIRIIRP